MGKGWDVLPAFLSLLLTMLVLGVVVERAPLMVWFNGRAASTATNPNTGALSPTSATAIASGLAPVPDVRCWTASVAEQAIVGSGFQVADHFTIDPTIPPGVISRTDPPAGRTLALGSVVTLTISTGQPSGGRLSRGCPSIVQVMPSDFFVPITPPPNP